MNHEAHEGFTKDIEAVARLVVNAGLKVHRALGAGRRVTTLSVKNSHGHAGQDGGAAEELVRAEPFAKHPPPS